MKKIEIKNFKAFRYKLELKLAKDSDNALICGENGAGKSSLFAAIRYAYLRDDILSNLSASGTPAEDVAANIADYKTNLNNQKKRDVPFSILVNDVDADAFVPSDEIACFISREMVLDRKQLSLYTIAKAMLVSETTVRDFLAANGTQIVTIVNAALSNKFYERLQVEILPEGDWICQLKETDRGLDGVYDELSVFFNEAKLNLVIMLVMMAIARIQFDQATESKHLLVCDDLVTSLDLTNRQMMINYVLDTFPNEQKIIFTHNVSFFNLFRHIINVRQQTSVKWHYYSMYEISNRHRIYEFETMSVKKIKEKLAKGKPIQDVGNEIRKYFEALVVELSRIHHTEFTIDTMESLLTKLKNNDPVYIFQQGQKINYSDDLVSSIEHLINNAPRGQIISKIKDKIRQYKKANTDLQPLTQTVKNLEIFQKIILHPLSHGANTYPSVSIKEEKIILDLMEKLEKLVKKGKQTNRTGNITDM